jgi:hypothetical protein
MSTKYRFFEERRSHLNVLPLASVHTVNSSSAEKKHVFVYNEWHVNQDFFFSADDGGVLSA